MILTLVVAGDLGSCQTRNPRRLSEEEIEGSRGFSSWRGLTLGFVRQNLDILRLPKGLYVVFGDAGVEDQSRTRLQTLWSYSGQLHLTMAARGMGAL